MKRRLFLSGLAVTAALGVLAGPALAASYAEDVVAQLTNLGFSNISVETTWLGRIKILATRSGGVREIVLNPRTGEILRDVWTPQSSSGARRLVLDDVEDSDDGGNSGSGSDGSDDDGGDDSDSEDDNSGKDDSKDDDKSDSDNSDD